MAGSPVSRGWAVRLQDQSIDPSFWPVSSSTAPWRMVMEPKRHFFFAPTSFATDAS